MSRSSRRRQPNGPRFDCFEAIGRSSASASLASAGQYAVKVNLSGPVKPGTELPDEINGVPVRVEVTGVDSDALTRRPRGAPPSGGLDLN